jgi:hypothetical protein
MKIMMQHRKEFGIWRTALAAVVVTLPALLAQPSAGEDTHGVEVLVSGGAQAPEPEGERATSPEGVAAVINLAPDRYVVEYDRPRPGVTVLGWDPEAPSRLRVIGQETGNPSRIPTRGWDPGTPNRIRVHSWSGGTP